MNEKCKNYLIKNYGRVDKTLEDMAKELNFTAKTLAVYAQRMGLRRNTIFPLEKNEYFKNMSAIGYSKYNISNYGKITNINGVLITSSPHHQTGYLQTRIYNDENIRKSVLIHVLVAKMFYTKDEYYGLQVNHIDSNRINNYYENLEWVTASENVQKIKSRTPVTRYLKESEVRDICSQLEKQRSISEICKTNDFYTKSKVEKIKQRIRWVKISKEYNF